MENYDPNHAIDSQDWLALNEQERQQLVEDYHNTLNLSLERGALKMHCMLHVVVENQLAESEYPILRQTLAKLIRQGLNRHEAIHAISSILSNGLFEAMQGSDSEFSIKKYRGKLEKITAKRWLKGLT